jgi:CDP-6-deoxy-D-xylo-4-hexulose-3-dehydrase
VLPDNDKDGVADINDLDSSKTINTNRKKILFRVKNSPILNKKIDFYYENKNVTPSWFGLPIKILINKKKYKYKVLKNLEKNGIETRPIISGNFANQPAAKLYKLCKKNEKFEKSQNVQDLGFLIGLHTRKISKSNLKLIHDAFFMIDQI